MNRYNELTNMNAKPQTKEKPLQRILRTLKTSKQSIFTRSEMESLVLENRTNWNVSTTTSVSAILKILVEAKHLNEFKFTFPQRKETRYVFGKVTTFEIAQSLKPHSYLTHLGAMYLHGLTQDPPDMINVNVEQSKEHVRAHESLTQASLTNAFKANPRNSNEIAESNGIQVRIVHGQKTDRSDVITIDHKTGSQLRVTNLERTLLDITIRPFYAGGPQAVLNAYRQAKTQGTIRIENLVQTLTKMDYVYPYHQAIGFYMEKAGVYDEREIELLKSIPTLYDFYLEHGMEEPKYSQRWRIYFPKTLK